MLFRSQGVYNLQLQRWIFRQAFGRFIRPFNRFRRLEISATVANLAQSTLNQITQYDPTGFPIGSYDSISSGASKVFAIPSIALVYDNSIFGYTSPFLGHRYRFEIGQAIGGLRYTQALLDYRQYTMIGLPFFTFATRITASGRAGPDEAIFPSFIGTPDKVRGYTYGSYVNNECSANLASGGGTLSDGCRGLNQLIGTRMVVARAEIRFPLLRSGAFGFLPFALPPIEGAFFFDAGLSWQNGSTVQWTRNPNDPDNVRAPISSYGAAVRINLFGYAILNIDYAIPRNRPGQHGYWILSLNPPF